MSNQDDSGPSRERITTYAQIPGALRRELKLQSLPLREGVQEFGFGLIFILPTLMIFITVALELLSLMAGIPEPEIVYDVRSSRGAFLWDRYAAYTVAVPLLLCMVWFGLRGWIRQLRRARRLEDLPTSTARAAAQGEVEVRGKAVALADGSLTSALGRGPCVWHSHRVTHQVRNHKGELRKQIVSDGSTADPILLDDGTGLIVLLPGSCLMTTLAAITTEPEPGVTRVEREISVGDEIFAWGTLETLNGPWPGGDPLPASLSQDIAKRIEATIAQRQADPAAPVAIPLLLPLRDGMPVTIALKDQNPLVNDARWMAKLHLFCHALAVVTLCMVQQMLWVAVH